MKETSVSHMEGISCSSEGSTSLTAAKVECHIPEGTDSWHVLPTLWRRKLTHSQRLEVLHALGGCKTVRKVDTIHAYVCELSIEEWEALLLPLKSNPVLEEICIRLPPSDSIAAETWERISRCWWEILKNAPTVSKLVVYVSRFSHSLTRAMYQEPSLKPSLHELRIIVDEDYEDYGLLRDSGNELSDPAAMIESFDGLRNLFLANLPRDLHAHVVKALSTALKRCTSLCILRIHCGSPETVAEVLTEAFTGEGSNQSLKELILQHCRVSNLEAIWYHALPGLLTANIPYVSLYIDTDTHLIHKSMHRSKFISDGGGIARSLLHAVRLRKFSIVVNIALSVGDVNSSGLVEWANEIKELWDKSEQSPLLHICLELTITGDCFKGKPELSFSLDFLKDVRFDGLRDLKVHLDFTYLFGRGRALFDPLAEFLFSHSDVEKLELEWKGGQNNIIISERQRDLLYCLRSNTSIKVLILHSSFYKHGEDVFDTLIQLLQENFTLREIAVQSEEWKRSGNDARLQEALNRNARHAEYISIVRNAGLELSTTKAGRVFLWGAPYAGKTRLKTTMVHTAKRHFPGSGKFMSFFWSKMDFKLLRTEGIEIATLRDDEEMHLTVWDLAGQWIFRALQDMLFPISDQYCIFLFLFNPAEIVNGHGRRQEEVDLETAFEKELRSWLRYIASNRPASRNSLPQVLVVFSHKDKVAQRDNEGKLDWAKPIMDRLRSTFEGVVDLCSHQEIEFISCFDFGEVKVLTDSIFRRMKSNFAGARLNLMPVPLPGIELTALFGGRPRETRSSPVWSSSELYRFLCNHNDALQNLDPESANGRTILEALARYLHDVGTIVMIPESDLIVVDPHWMSHEFLGRLISEGHSFQSETGRPYASSELTRGSCEDGFVGLNALNKILSHLLHKYRKRGITISMKDLRDLLFKLDLCFEQGAGDPRYFMPAVVGGPDPRLPAEMLRWKANCSDGSKDFGFRLQCLDRERTCLTNSFFPLFQIKLRNTLVQKRKMNDKSVICSPGLVQIREDGHEIYVESDKLAEDYIDIMVRPSTHRTKEEAREFVDDHIIQLMRSFCASEMGCPGVSLSLCVLRTRCVTNLTPRDHRRDDQAISVEVLKEKLILGAQNQLKESMRTSVDDRIESCLRYAHSWPAVEHPDPKVHLPPDSELAKELLPLNVIQETKEELRRILENLNPRRDQRRTREGQLKRRWLTDEVYEIHSPPDGRPRVELVFVHGILADETEEEPNLTTWSTRNSSHECWLDTWLVSQSDHEVDLKFARVLTVHYDSSVRKTECKGTMDSFLTSEHLAISLITLAHVGQHDCPVVLVGHCLGGLVIKEVCIQASIKLKGPHLDSTLYANFLNKVKGFFFYSTPHLGFNSKLVHVDSQLPPASEKAELMECLELLNHRTSRKISEFKLILDNYNWKTRGVGESNRTKIRIFKDAIESAVMEEVVQESSVRAGSLESFCIIPNTDHFMICRPDSETSNNFQYLVNFIKTLLRKIDSSTC